MGGWINANFLTQWKKTAIQTTYEFSRIIRVSRRNSDQTVFLKVAGKWHWHFWSKDIPKYVDWARPKFTGFHSGAFEGEMPVPFSQKRIWTTYLLTVNQYFDSPQCIACFLVPATLVAMDARAHGLPKVIQWSIPLHMSRPAPVVVAQPAVSQSPPLQTHEDVSACLK